MKKILITLLLLCILTISANAQVSSEELGFVELSNGESMLFSFSIIRGEEYAGVFLCDKYRIHYALLSTNWEQWCQFSEDYNEAYRKLSAASYGSSGFLPTRRGRCCDDTFCWGYRYNEEGHCLSLDITGNGKNACVSIETNYVNAVSRRCNQLTAKFGRGGTR
jgi:hypothetical protein